MVLIIGCGGYIGRRLAARLLEKGLAVRGLILSHEYEACIPLIKMGLECRIGNLITRENLKDLCQGVDCIYYLAGGHYRTIQRTREIYVDGLKNVLQTMGTKELRCLIYASNGAVYKDVGESFLVENSSSESMHPFGKIVAEAEEILINHKTIVNPIIMRIGEVYGMGKYNPFQYRGKKFTLIGNGQNYMSLIHEYDLISQLEKAAEYLDAGIYNLVDDRPVRQSEYYHQVETVCGQHFVEWMEANEIPERILFSIHGLRSLNIKMSNRKIKEKLNYQLQFPSYEEGLKMIWQESVEIISGVEGSYEKNFVDAKST